LGLQIPEPDRRVDPEGEGGGTFRGWAFPALGIFAAQMLLDVTERVLDGPAARIVADHGLGRGVQVGGKEEVILFPAFGLAADDR